MKSLYQYILEADDDLDLGSDDLGGDDVGSNDASDENPDDTKEKSDDKDNDKPDDEKLKRRGNIKFTIWDEPKKKVDWLKLNINI